jgi:hypothetical protein
MLVDLVSLDGWEPSVLHAMAAWSSFGPKYVDSQLSKRRPIDLLRKCTVNAAEKGESLDDVASLLANCPKFAALLPDARLINTVASFVDDADHACRAQLVEFLPRLVIQLNDPTAAARSLLPVMATLTEVEDFRLQRAALRFRLLARC